MAKTRSMTTNQNLDSSSSSSSSGSRKRFKTFDNRTPPWSDVNHDVLFLVMKKLGVVDFLAFSGVCKSWRSFALSNKKMFMVSLPPMSMKILVDAKHYYEKDYYCHLEDFGGRSFKTTLPHSAGKMDYGSTCGYLILFGRETRDFWLVNPITRHELHFPDFPLHIRFMAIELKAILVFSPSISGWVFVVLRRNIRDGKTTLSYYIAGKRRWNHVSSTLPIIDLHFFKGKIYTLHTNCSLGELGLNLMRKRKWTIQQTNNSSNLPNLDQPLLVSSAENLYLIDMHSESKKVLELDFGEMKWVSPEKTIGEYTLFISCDSAIKPLSWLGFFDTHENQQRMFIYGGNWYSLHDCLNVNVLDG